MFIKELVSWLAQLVPSRMLTAKLVEHVIPDAPPVHQSEIVQLVLITSTCWPSTTQLILLVFHNALLDSGSMIQFASVAHQIARVATVLPNISAWIAIPTFILMKANVSTSAVPWSIKIKNHNIASGAIPVVLNAGDQLVINASLVSLTIISTIINVSAAVVQGPPIYRFLLKDYANPVNSDASTAHQVNFAISVHRVTTTTKVGAISTVLTTCNPSTLDTICNSSELSAKVVPKNTVAIAWLAIRAHVLNAKKACICGKIVNSQWWLVMLFRLTASSSNVSPVVLMALLLEITNAPTVQLIAINVAVTAVAFNANLPTILSMVIVHKIVLRDTMLLLQDVQLVMLVVPLALVFPTAPLAPQQNISNSIQLPKSPAVCQLALQVISQMFQVGASNVQVLALNVSIWLTAPVATMVMLLLATDAQTHQQPTASQIVANVQVEFAINVTRLIFCWLIVALECRVVWPAVLMVFMLMLSNAKDAIPVVLLATILPIIAPHVLLPCSCIGAVVFLPVLWVSLPTWPVKDVRHVLRTVSTATVTPAFHAKTVSSFTEKNVSTTVLLVPLPAQQLECASVVQEIVLSVLIARIAPVAYQDIYSSITPVILNVLSIPIWPSIRMAIKCVKIAKRHATDVWIVKIVFLVWVVICSMEQYVSSNAVKGTTNTLKESNIPTRSQIKTSASTASASHVMKVVWLAAILQPTASVAPKTMSLSSMAVNASITVLMALSTVATSASTAHHYVYNVSIKQAARFAWVELYCSIAVVWLLVLRDTSQELCRMVICNIIVLLVPWPVRLAMVIRSMTAPVVQKGITISTECVWPVVLKDTTPAMWPVHVLHVLRLVLTARHLLIVPTVKPVTLYPTLSDAPITTTATVRWPTVLTVMQWQ